MTPTEAWAVVRPDGSVWGVYMIRAIADNERAWRDHIEPKSRPHKVVRVRIEEAKK